MAISAPDTHSFNGNTGGIFTFTADNSTFVAFGAGSADTMTITVDGVSCTKIASTNFAGEWLSTFMLTGLTSGAHTIALNNFTTATNWQVLCGAYPASSAINPDSIPSSVSGGGRSLIDSNPTPVAAGCWSIAFGYSSATSSYTYTRCTSRLVSTNTALFYVDTNGISNPGIDMQVNGSNGNWFMQGFTIKPTIANITSLSDSLMNGASRTVGIVRLQTLLRTLSDLIMRGASRTTTITKGSIRGLSSSIMNGASRLTTISRSLINLRTFSDNIMNAKSRFVTIINNKFKWLNEIKSATSWIKQVRNFTIFSNQSKTSTSFQTQQRSSSAWQNQNKDSLTWNNQSKS